MAADEDYCPGTCNSRWRRETALYKAKLAEYDADLASIEPGDPVPDPPESPEVRPWRRAPVWCSRCSDLIRAELPELTDLASQLAMLPPGIRPVVKGPAVKVTGSRARQSPSPSGDGLDDLRRWLRSWHGVLIGDDEVVPRYDDEGTEMRKTAAVLYHSFAVLITNPDYGEDFGREIRSWHRLLDDCVHEGSYPRHVKQPCPKCRRYTLFERPGDEYLACARDECGARPTRAELELAAS